MQKECTSIIFQCYSSLTHPVLKTSLSLRETGLYSYNGMVFFIPLSFRWTMQRNLTYYSMRSACPSDAKAFLLLKNRQASSVTIRRLLADKLESIRGRAFSFDRPQVKK